MLYLKLHPHNNSAFPYTKPAVILLWFLKKKLESRVLDFEVFWKPGIKGYNKINELSNTTYNIPHMCVVCELWFVNLVCDQKI
jgi:hypothetical protein